MLKGSVKFINKTPIVSKKITDLVDIATGKGAFILERHVKISATNSFKQRTGNLRRSISAFKNKPGESEVRINPVREGADTNYGIFLEFGTKYITPTAFIRKGAKESEDEIHRAFLEQAKKVYNGNIGI